MRRLEAAKAMCACCVIAYLVISVTCGFIGVKLTGEQFAFAMTLVACAAAAWLSGSPEPSGRE